jgi:ABC-type multidrug transport system fused ATPase/permease subunit
MCSFAALTHGASRTHNVALAGVLRAPLSFFAANAAGSVLNRFSGDQRAVDDDLPETLVDLWAGLHSQVAGFVLAIVAFPPVVAAIVPAAGLLWWLRSLYVRASAQAQRLEAAARSPVLARMRAMVEVRRRAAGLFFLRAPRAAPRAVRRACCPCRPHTLTPLRRSP